MTYMVDAAPLVCSSYTLGTEVGFPDRVRAAAAAGYDGIGLRAENYWDADLDDATMLAVAEQHGVRILEVEYLTGWGTAADRDEAQQKKEQPSSTWRARSACATSTRGCWRSSRSTS